MAPLISYVVYYTVLALYYGFSVQVMEDIRDSLEARGSASAPIKLISRALTTPACDLQSTWCASVRRLLCSTREPTRAATQRVLCFCLAPDTCVQSRAESKPPPSPATSPVCTGHSDNKQVSDDTHCQNLDLALLVLVIVSEK